MDERTKLLHAGGARDPFTGASSIPIYQVSTFAQEDPVELGPYDYGRGANPTRNALEEAVAALEGGERGLAFASGVAAIASTLLLFQPGDHLVVAEDVYGGTYRLLNGIFRRWQLDSTFVDFSAPDRIEAAITPRTVALFAESPSNPILKITDLRAVADLGRRRGLLTLVDNTFMTPYLQRPLELGFDVVLHSATKFLGGHSDLIAGLAVSRSGELGNRLKRIQNAFGAILGPQDSWLVLRGIKTLAARMDAQQKTAGELAGWLSGETAVERVYYPSLPGHPGADVHRAQAAGGGAVVSFALRSGGAARRFLKAVRLPLVGVSLGGVETILSYPASMSHASVPREERLARGISDGLVRLSVGLESFEDLRADLAQALGAAG